MRPMLELALPTDAPCQDVPFAIEPISAWRAWSVVDRHDRGPTLRSITHHAWWPHREAMRARCLTQTRAIIQQRTPTVLRHSCPHNGHRCGIYALREEDDLRSWATTSFHVAGRVKLWGRVYLYERGFIAEYAYPVAITFRVSEECVPDEQLERLCESYGIDLEV